MATKPLPCATALRQLLDYHPTTGKLFWRERGPSWFSADRLWKTWNTRFSGRESMTTIGSHGYKCGTVLGVHALAHRVIWLMVYGEAPDQIDHINGVITDNELSNLRAVSNLQNSLNKSIYSTNISGVTGVRSSPTLGKWIAELGSAGRSKHLGTFDTFEDAVEARKAAEVAYGYHPNHGREAAT